MFLPLPGRIGPRFMDNQGVPVPGVGFVKLDAEGKEVAGVRGYKVGVLLFEILFKFVHTFFYINFF